jgi:hypothetical protein
MTDEGMSRWKDMGETNSRYEKVFIVHTQVVASLVDKTNGNQPITHLGHNNPCIFDQSTVNGKVVNQSVYATNFDV